MSIFSKTVESQDKWLIRIKAWLKNNFALYHVFRRRLGRLMDQIRVLRHADTDDNPELLPLKRAVEGNVTRGWEACRQSLAGFASIARDRNLPLLFVIYPYLGHLGKPYPFEAIHALLNRTATDYGMTVVDLIPHFIGHEPATLWVSPRDSHPNALANQIAARGIFMALMADPSIPHRTLGH